jgi:RND superfamily putative drug exporter
VISDREQRQSPHDPKTGNEEGSERCPRRHSPHASATGAPTTARPAIFGWLAFVVIAFVLGGAIGTQNIKDEDQGNGQSRTADRQVAAANFPKEADENVLIQAKGDGKATDHSFTLAVKDTTKRLQDTKYVTKVESPLEKGNEGQFSKDGRSALITFSIPATTTRRRTACDTSEATVAAAQKAPP